MERVEHAREDVASATRYVVDTWTAVPHLARLELRSATEALSALVPALDALVRAMDWLVVAEHEYDTAVRLAGYRAGDA